MFAKPLAEVFVTPRLFQLRFLAMPRDGRVLQTAARRIQGKQAEPKRKAKRLSAPKADAPPEAQPQAQPETQPQPEAQPKAPAKAKPKAKAKAKGKAT